MGYNRKYYDARKKNVIMKANDNGNEEYRAYRIIRDKWDFDDRTISRLLREYTVTEILAGEYAKGKFNPKELFNTKGLLALLAIALLLGITIYHTFQAPAPILSSITDKIGK